MIDGRFEFVGRDERRAITTIESAAKIAKIPVSINSIHLEAGNMVALRIVTGQLPSSVAAESAEVLIATADENDESHVSRGENAGRTLKHIAALRSLTRVGTWIGPENFLEMLGSISIMGTPGAQGPSPSFKRGRRVLGVGWARLSN